MKDFIEQCKATIKENLVAIIKFGNETRPDNLLIVTKQFHFEDLEKLKTILDRKKKVVPVLFTEAGLRDSADVFPLEILDMMHPHEVLHGANVFEKVSIHKKHVRRQLEYELRSKLIHLRENYIWIQKKKDLKSLLAAAVPSVMPLFYGLLHLKDVAPPTELDDLFRLVEEQYEIDLTVFKTIRQQQFKDLPTLIKELIQALETLINAVDTLSV